MPLVLGADEASLAHAAHESAAAAQNRPRLVEPHVIRVPAHLEEIEEVTHTRTPPSATRHAHCRRVRRSRMPRRATAS